MAISAYIGLPGSGKSYGVVENVILPALKDKREVWTNIPMSLEKLSQAGYKQPLLFEIEDIQKNIDWFDEVLPKGVLLVLDECQLLWPSGLKQTTANPKHIEFLTKHRHLVANGRSTEIILLTQRLSLIANFARAVVEKTLITNNLGILGTPNKYRVDIYAGSITTDSPNLKNRVKDDYGKYKKEIYQFYKSHTSSDEGAGNETRIDGRLNIWIGWKPKAFIILFIGLLYIVYAGLNNVYKSFVSEPEPKIKTAPIKNNLKRSPPVPPKSIKVKTKVEDKFLSKVSKIHISLNMGIYPKVIYQFKAKIGSGSVDLNTEDLVTLGYRLRPINPCMVELIGQSYSQYIYCESNGNNGGLLSNAVTSTVSKSM